jgi:hypothetical protein
LPPGRVWSSFGTSVKFRPFLPWTT